MRRLLALVALALAGSVGNAQAATITFEDHAVPSGTAQPQRQPDFGWIFLRPSAPNDQFANNSARVDDGSTYLVIQGSLTRDNPFSQVTFSQIGGTPFALLSLISPSGRADLSAAATITVTGNRVGGGTVDPCSSRTATSMQAAADTDFQTFAFGPQWTNLASVVLLGLERQPAPSTTSRSTTSSLAIAPCQSLGR